MRAPLLLLLPLLQICTSLPATTEIGAVASEVSECSDEAGVAILKKGGNAVDAMIATVLCVGTIGMYHSGIGGGGFALIRLPNGTYSHIDFREAAPAAATENMYVDNPDASLYGGLAAGVPGELRGLELMHNSYGSLPWHTLFQPAIRFARNGFRINSDLANAMDFDKYPFLDQDPAWAEDFSSTKTRGGRITRKRYADTLEEIARGGADVFYRGPLAERFVATVQETGGIMTMKDMASYEAKERKAVHGEYKGYKVHTCGSPSSGAVALSAWKIFEGFNKTDDRDVETHRMIEAAKFAYGQRTVLGDPDFVDGVDEFEGEMVDEKIAAQLRVRIKDDRVLPNISFYNPAGLRSPTPAGGTSHIVTLDASGLAVSLTTTINTFWGSTNIVPHDGVILNNEMDDFSTPNATNYFGYLPTPNNFILGGKRPLSSISPAIIETPDGKPYFVIGAAGGSRITTATIQNVLHVLEHGMNARQALAMPRWHDQLTPDQETTFEYSYCNGTVDAMRERGHNVTWVELTKSSVQGILVHDGRWMEAVGEPRQKASGGSVARKLDFGRGGRLKEWTLGGL